MFRGKGLVGRDHYVVFLELQRTAQNPEAQRRGTARIYDVRTFLAAYQNRLTRASTLFAGRDYAGQRSIRRGNLPSTKRT